MPDPELKSIFDLEPDAALETRLDAAAEADVAAGRIVSNDKVAAWLTKCANGERLPPPTP